MPTIVRGKPEEYQVGQKHVGPGFSPACLRFSSVTHTAHVRNAINIVADRKIRADLVYDESHLNSERTRVVWLSPNDWYPGSRYGNVVFEFPWADLIANKFVYWVEVALYKIPACRLLITSKEHKDHPFYNATDGKGPWWHDPSTGEHFFNNHYCLEFMFEDDMSLDHLTMIGFTRHHPEWCNLNRKNPKACPDLNVPDDVGAALFIGGVCANGLAVDQLRMTLKAGEKVVPMPSLVKGWGKIRDRVKILSDKGDLTYTGTTRSHDPAAQAIATSILSAMYRRVKDEWVKLAGLFLSADDAIEAIAVGLEQKFGVVGGVGLPRTDDAWDAWNKEFSELQKAAED